MQPRGLLLVFSIVTGILILGGEAFADPLLNASKQRIGNYDFEMTTEPASPVVGSPAKILLRMAGVNGDDLVDVPISVRIVKDGVELHRTTPVVVPYGHHTIDYAFPETGRYVLYVDLKDYAYSGETLTFTFLLNIAGPLDYLGVVVPVLGGGASAAVIAVLMMKKRKRMASPE
ncbi:MAG TPA: hypothetical protein VIB07_09805 [Nitrososphaera sp.]